MPKTEIVGIGDMKTGFKQVKGDMRTKTARSMLVSAGRILKDKAKEIAIANGSRRTGAMINNVAIKREKGAPVDSEQYHLGVRHGRNLSTKQKTEGARLSVNARGRVVKRYLDDPYYWRFVELGHKVVGRQPVADGQTVYKQRLVNGRIVTRKAGFSGKSLRARRRAPTGSVAPKPFIGPALEQGRDAAVKAMEASLVRSLERAGKS